MRPSPAAKVSLVATVLGLLGFAMLAWMPTLGSVTTEPIVLLPFAIAFIASEAAVFHLEIRRQAHTFSLGEVVLVIGLFTVHPALLVMARVIGGGAALAWRRQAPLKAFFNLCLFSAEVSLAGLVFGHVASDVSTGLSALGALLGVAVADLLGVGAVWTAIAIFEGRPRRRQVSDVLLAQLLVTLVAASVGVVGAVALDAGTWTITFLVIFAGGAVAVFRKYASVTGLYTSLQTLHDFSRSIADDLDHQRVLRRAIHDLQDILTATDVVGVVLDETSTMQPGLYRPVDGDLVAEPFSGDREEWEALVTESPTIRSADGLPDGIVKQLDIAEGQLLIGELVIGHAYRVIVIATKSAEAVGRFDSTSVEQLEVVLRYVTATATNGVVVEEIEAASRRDPLTGLANRGELERQLGEAGDTSVGMLVISMDEFSSLTDSLGHSVGDQVLQVLAERMATAARGAVVARLDGASFAVMYRDVGVADVIVGANQVLTDVAGDLQTELSLVDVRCRAGVAASEDPGNHRQLVRCADLALSEARRSGEQVVVYTQDLDDAQQRRIRLVADLRRAIDSDDFDVWYQPKMDLATGRVCGAEALIRWHHPLLGAVSPDEFIPLAETTGSIRDVTSVMVSTVVRQVAAWRELASDIEVAVNLSAIDLLDEELPAWLADILAEHAVDATAVGLEVTETAIMADEDRVVANLGRLRAAGHKIYIDDYGTGQSSLAYLKTLPIDALKIDRAFITDLGASETDDVIVSSTIELAHSLGLSVVAEGIEGRVAFERLRELGCEYAQGYFLARPMDRSQFEVWLGDSAKLRALLGFEDAAGVDDAEQPVQARDRATT